MLDKQMKISDGKLKTGFVGTPLLCKVLTEVGRKDLAYGLLLNEDYPGWIYEIKLGATTVWERWNSVLADGSISSTGMNSLNHYAYGSICEWIFGYCGGLKPVEEVPGFKKVTIAPVIHKALSPFALSYDSSAGGYEVAWEILDDNHLKVDITIPFDATAVVTLPLSGKEPFEVGAGPYSYTYETTESFVKILSIDSSMRELLADPDINAMLKHHYPQIDELPEGMKDLSLREVAKANSDISDVALEQLNSAISKLQEK